LKKLAALTILILVAAVSPVLAAGPTHAPKPSKPTHDPCTPHAKRYHADGTLVSGSLTPNSDGTYSGTLTVHVKHVNHPWKSDKNTDQTYTLDHARVHLGKKVDPSALAAGDRVKIDGKRTTVGKKCTQTDFTPTTTVKHADIKAAPKPHPHPAKPRAGHAA
jgi:hypothetical protein